MSVWFDSIVLWSEDAPRTAAMYRALGVALEEEQHGDGPVHYAAAVGGVHFAIHSGRTRAGATPRRGEKGATQLGLRVQSADAAVALAVAFGGRVLLATEEKPWGRRAVVEDPDGRRVELNEPPAENLR